MYNVYSVGIRYNSIIRCDHVPKSYALRINNVSLFLLFIHICHNYQVNHVAGLNVVK